MQYWEPFFNKAESSEEYCYAAPFLLVLLLLSFSWAFKSHSLFLQGTVQISLVCHAQWGIFFLFHLFKPCRASLSAPSIFSLSQRISSLLGSAVTPCSCSVWVHSSVSSSEYARVDHTPFCSKSNPFPAIFCTLSNQPRKLILFIPTACFGGSPVLGYLWQPSLLLLRYLHLAVLVTQFTHTWGLACHQCSPDWGVYHVSVCILQSQEIPSHGPL